MAGAAFATLLIGGHVFSLFWLLAALAIFWEWQAMIGGRRRFSRLLIGALALAGASPLAGDGRPGGAVAVLAVGAVLLGWQADGDRRVLAALGLVYSGSMVLAVSVLRRSFPDGIESVLWLFAVVWGTDVMAYFGGRLLGGPKLIPRLSPSKTWSGFVVGICSGSALGLAVAPQPNCYPCILVLGLVGGVAAQVGDIFESALKRRFGVKDASRMIPGHGGVMDRLDGFIAASVLAAVFGAWRYGLDAAGAGVLKW